ncbi:hypothetical protein LIER_18999 [Lithospermum erythrorhizon]|uniref:Uncharacterized protein n=1 Tax=Lithospermum erythrorhizon TaxID=34254 RepID=A0AAV3QG30_LITER
MDNQNISGENQHAPTTPLANFQGEQHDPLPADIEEIIQERIRQEQMAWEAEQAAQDHARFSRERNPSQHGYLRYTDNEESYSNEEARNISVAPTPQRREQPQTPVVHRDPIVTAMQQKLDTFKKFMATAFPTSIAPVAPTTKMSFSDRLDAFQLLPGFKLP